MSEKINVDQAFDPELRQAQADFDAYLATRPYQDEAGKSFTPDGAPMQDDYFDQARTDHYDDTHESYEDLTMTQLADELAYAELTEDQTKVDDISDVLLDKMDAFARAQVTERNPDGMTPDAQMNLFDRIMRHKETVKEKYLETNGHEISERVRNESIASLKDEDKDAAIEKFELDQLGELYRETFQRAAEAEAGSEEQARLLEEAQQLGSELYRRQVLASVAQANAAQNEGSEWDEMIAADQARADLEEYLGVNGIDSDSDEAQALRNRLEDALESGDTSLIFDTTPGAGEDDIDDDFDGGDELPPVGDDDDVEREQPARRTLRDRWNALKNRQYREAFARNPRNQSEKEQKTSRVRMFVGAALLFGAGVALGFALDSDDNQAKKNEYPVFIQEEIDQNEALQDAGVDNVETRESIIHNPDDFKRMVENPDKFKSMLNWQENRVEELMATGASMSRAEAQARAEKQFRDFAEDLDDDDEARFIEPKQDDNDVPTV